MTVSIPSPSKVGSPELEPGKVHFEQALKYQCDRQLGTSFTLVCSMNSALKALASPCNFRHVISVSLSLVSFGAIGKC